MNKNLFPRVKELGDKDFELMLLGWLRYSLGRQTYIVGTCSQYIMHLLPVLSDWCLDNMESDLESFACDVEQNIRCWGADFDKKTWMHLWDALVVEMTNRKNKKD